MLTASQSKSSKVAAEMREGLSFGAEHLDFQCPKVKSLRVEPRVHVEKLHTETEREKKKPCER